MVSEDMFHPYHGERISVARESTGLLLIIKHKIKINHFCTSIELCLMEKDHLTSEMMGASVGHVPVSHSVRP